METINSNDSIVGTIFMSINLIAAACLIIIYSIAFRWGLCGYKFKVSLKPFLAIMIAIQSSFLMSSVRAITRVYYEPWICNTGMILACLSYGGVSLFLYVFLLLRARSVEFSRPNWMSKLEKLMISVLILYLCLALILIPMNVRGNLYPSQQNPSQFHCVISIRKEGSILFFLFDLILSLGFLLLFAYPLRGNSNVLHRNTLRENLIFSAIMIISTSIVMCLYGFYVHDPNSADFVGGLTHIDAFVNVMCVLFITRRGWKLKDERKTPSRSAHSVRIHRTTISHYSTGNLTNHEPDVIPDIV